MDAVIHRENAIPNGTHSSDLTQIDINPDDAPNGSVIHEVLLIAMSLELAVHWASSTGAPSVRWQSII